MATANHSNVHFGSRYHLNKDFRRHHTSFINTQHSLLSGSTLSSKSPSIPEVSRPSIPPLHEPQTTTATGTNQRSLEAGSRHPPRSKDHFGCSLCGQWTVAEKNYGGLGRVLKQQDPRQLLRRSCANTHVPNPLTDSSEGHSLGICRTTPPTGGGSETTLR